MILGFVTQIMNNMRNSAITHFKTKPESGKIQL